jgi:hypothetical protein
MPTTSNFGWTTPADTDLVKDGAAAIRTLGNGVDTSFVDLKGGTTGQVLAKASGTDLDFNWVTDATGIPATIFDAKGDIIAATAADTASRLAVGSNGTFLKANSATATGLEWGSASVTPNGYVLFSTTTMTGANSITVSGISDKSSLIIVLYGVGAGTSGSFGDTVDIFINGSTSGYRNAGLKFTGSGDTTEILSGTSLINAFALSGNTASVGYATCWIDGANSADPKIYKVDGMAAASGGSNQVGYAYQGVYTGAAVTSIVVKSTEGSGNNFDAGTMYIYAKAV